jgi:hypothetical protein
MTATAAQSSLPLERREHENEAEIATVGLPELPAVRERRLLILVAILLIAEVCWLGAIAYGFFLLAR